MKRAYVRPTMVGERFVANEYVAACGGTEYGKYKFECNNMIYLCKHENQFLDLEVLGIQFES